MSKRIYFRDQGIALVLTAVTCAFLIWAVWLEVTLLNRHTSHGKIALAIRPADVIIGMTIYLKTAIDFAVFIAKLMDKNPGLKGRIGIEVGTALGNGVGSMAILLIWTFFRRVHWLLALMIVVAALVLLRLAQDTVVEVDGERHPYFRKIMVSFEGFLAAINKVTHPLLSRIVPSNTLEVKYQKTLLALLGVAFTVPFVLGLDDFAGYVPVFNIVNVFGFIVGVLLGHMILNIALYVSPRRTIATIENPVIAFVGGVAFVLLAGWGFVEAFRLI